MESFAGVAVSVTTSSSFCASVCGLGRFSTASSSVVQVITTCCCSALTEFGSVNHDFGVSARKGLTFVNVRYERLRFLAFLYFYRYWRRRPNNQVRPTVLAHPFHLLSLELTWVEIIDPLSIVVPLGPNFAIIVALVSFGASS